MRAASLSTRLHLFLNTALPNLFGATKATPAPAPSSTATRMRRREALALFPQEKTLSNSRGDLMVFTERILKQ